MIVGDIFGYAWRRLIARASETTCVPQFRVRCDGVEIKRVANRNDEVGRVGEEGGHEAAQAARLLVNQTLSGCVRIDRWVVGRCGHRWGR